MSLAENGSKSLRKDIFYKALTACAALSLSILGCFESKKQPPPSVEITKTPIIIPTQETKFLKDPAFIHPDIVVPQLFSEEFLNLTIAERTLFTMSVEDVLKDLGKTDQEISELLESQEQALEDSGLVPFLEEVGVNRKFNLDDLFILVRWRPIASGTYDDGTSWTGESSQSGIPNIVILEAAENASFFPILEIDLSNLEFSSDEPNIEVVTSENNNNAFNLAPVRHNIKELNFEALLEYLEITAKIQDISFITNLHSNNQGNQISLPHFASSKISIIKTQ